MTSPRARAIAVLALGLAVAVPAAGQPQPKDQAPERTLPPTSTELFRAVLDFHELKPISGSNIGSLPPHRVVVVVLGRLQPGDARSSLVNFTRAVLASGGAVLIATDEPGSLADFFPTPIDLTVTGERVRAPESVPRLQDNVNCPFVVPAVSIFHMGLGIGEPAEEQTMFLGLDRVAVNLSTTLEPGERRSPYIRNTLARFPKGCLEARSNELLASNRVFAVGGSGGAGERPFRCIVLADPSVFSNQMLLPGSDEGSGGNQNLIFANSVVRFLRDEDGQGRTHCLFVENGQVRDRFDEVKFAPGILPPKIPPLPIPSFTNPEFQQQLTDMVNGEVAAMQEKNSLNRKLAGSDRRYETTLRALAVSLGVLAILFFLSRVWRRRHEPDLPPVPTDTGRIAGSAPLGSIDRRREEVLQSGNYTPLVQEYLRGLFGERGLPGAMDPSPRAMPELQVNGKDAKLLKSHINILWGVAYGPSPRPVTYSRWKELEPMIELVRRAADEGRWHFAGERA